MVCPQQRRRRNHRRDLCAHGRPTLVEASKALKGKQAQWLVGKAVIADCTAILMRRTGRGMGSVCLARLKPDMFLAKAPRNERSALPSSQAAKARRA